MTFRLVRYILHFFNLFSAVFNFLLSLVEKRKRARRRANLTSSKSSIPRRKAVMYKRYSKRAVSNQAEHLRGARLTDNCVFRSRDTTRETISPRRPTARIYISKRRCVTYIRSALSPSITDPRASTFAARRTRRTMSMDLLRSVATR